MNGGVDGSGIDEVFQMLSGSGFVVHQRLDDGSILTLRRAAPMSGADGSEPTAESARISAASVRPNWKLQAVGAQAFGSPEWTLTYMEEPPLKSAAN